MFGLCNCDSSCLPKAAVVSGLYNRMSRVQVIVQSSQDVSIPAQSVSTLTPGQRQPENRGDHC